MGEKIRDCHYVPQTYQKQWLYDDKKLFYFSKENKQIILKSGNTTGLYRPDKQMFIRDYYDSTLENINFLEVYFSKNFENDWAKNIDSIKDTIDKNNCSEDVYDISIDQFSPESLNAILEFMAIQFFRIYENALGSINETIKNYGQNPALISDVVKREAWKGGLIDISSNAGYAPKLLDFFKNLHINFYISKVPSFILADNPVIKVLDAESRGEGYFFPLTPEICIEVNNSPVGNISIMNISETNVKNINYFLYSNCSFVFGYNNAIANMDDVIPPE